MTRHRCGLAVAILCGLTTAHVAAQSPQPIIAGTPSSPVPTPSHVDLYYGTKHVNPRSLLVPVVDDFTTSEKPTQALADEKTVCVPVVSSATWQPNGVQPARLHAGIPNGTSSLLHLLSTVMTRMVTASFPVPNGNTSHPQIVIIRETVPAPEPGRLQLSSASLPVGTAPQPAPQPTIVVVREPAETHTVEPAGIRISQELVAILAVGFTCLTVLLVILGRMPKQVVAPVISSPVSPPATLDAPEQSVQIDEALLDGQYKMGPLPETAERFEIGPSYHEELLQKKHDEESSRAAVVAQMLNLNTALFDEIAKEKLMPVVEPRTPIAFHGIVLPDAKA